MTTSFWVTVFVMLAAIVGGLAIAKRRAATSPKPTSAEHRRLLTICRGNEGQLRRLVQYEIERRPDLNERQAVRAAIARYERDIR